MSNHLHQKKARSEIVVEVSGLAKDFGAKRALDGVSFQVPRGQVVGLLGPNGAGKTTTMRILTGYLAATQGTARIDGLDVRLQPMETRRRIGYLPENAPLYNEMMVVEFLRFVAQMRGLSTIDARRRIGEAVDACGLGRVIGQDIGTLSKGFRQRVGLAQTLLHDPDVLILDEPTSGLDPNQIVDIRDLIVQLGKEKTVLLSTHILPEVQASCSRVIIIDAGRIVADDTTDALMASADVTRLSVTFASSAGHDLDGEAVRARLTSLSGVQRVTAGEAEPGQASFAVTHGPDVDLRHTIFALAVSENWVLLEMTREQVSLEETFRRLTGGTAQAA